jgi:hypothetical protein
VGIRPAPIAQWRNFGCLPFPGRLADSKKHSFGTVA